MASVQIKDFVSESNAIEGIFRDPTDDEVQAHLIFLSHKEITVPLVERFVSVCQPGAKLRAKPSMNVVVGNHSPPKGGPLVVAELKGILKAASSGVHPYHTHQAYEHLHPFMDGNGRSGRALWAWQMKAQGRTFYASAGVCFLQTFYYQALEFGGR